LTTVIWNATHCKYAIDAFSYCEKLQSIEFGEEVEILPARLCAYLPSLTTVTIPESVSQIFGTVFLRCDALKEINWNAIRIDGMQYGNIFSLCDNVTSVNFGNKVEVLPAYICSDMSKLQSVVIPASVKSIGQSAFSGCTSLIDIFISSAAKIETIGVSAFYETAWLENHEEGSIYIGSVLYMNKITNSQEIRFDVKEGTTSIVPYAFEQNYGLYEISLPASMVVLGDTMNYPPESVFRGCYDLRAIHVDEDNAHFASVDGNLYTKDKERLLYAPERSENPVTSITVKKDEVVTYMDFVNHMKLESVLVEDGHARYSSKDGILYDVTGDTLIYCPRQHKNPAIAEGTKVIGSHAFYNNNHFSTIEIPNSVTTIGNYAFEACYGLKNITIPESVHTMRYAFSLCDSLTTIVYNAKSPSGERFDGISSPFGYSPSSVTSFTIGNTVEVIPAGLCSRMNKLTNVTIPNSVKIIMNGAFDGCEGLTSFTIPESVTEIRGRIFGGWGLHFFLRENFINNSALDAEGYGYWGAQIVDGEIVNGLIIEDDIVVGCLPKITEIVIPKHVKGIAEYAIRSFNEVGYPICSLRVEEGNPWLDSRDNCNAVIETATNRLVRGLRISTIPEGVEIIGAGAFYGSEVWGLQLPNTVKVIEEGAFAGSPIKAIQLPESLVEIGPRAFQSCVNLTAIAIPENVSTIGEAAFDDCISLQSVSIAEGVTTIGVYAFYNCFNLSSITFPSTITYLGRNALEGCSCKSVTCLAVTPPELNGRLFDGWMGDVMLYVPCESVDAYRDRSEWVESFGDWSYDDRIRCIQMEPTDTSDVTVVASYHDATFTWPKSNEAASYTLALKHEDSDVVTLVFEANGTLNSMKKVAAASAESGYKYTVTDLQDGMSYNYMITIKDVNGQVLGNFEGEFQTLSSPANQMVTLAFNYDEKYGQVLGAGSYPYGTSVLIDFVPNEYCYLNDVDSDLPVYSYDNNYHYYSSVILTQDTIFDVEFRPYRYRVLVNFNHTMGYVLGAGVYNRGDEVTLTAVAEDGYEFSRWSDGSTENPYVFAVYNSTEITAEFVEPGTGVEDVLNSNKQDTIRKILHDGQIYIFRDGQLYTIIGQKVK
jgi:hypothetical protein